MGAKRNIEEIIDTTINSIIKEYTQRKGIILPEGVNYNESADSFTFNFQQDNERDIIKLTKVGYKVNLFNHTYYYGYQFENNVDSNKRTAFIHSIKFPDGKINNKDKNTFIINAVNKLDSDISLPKYKLIVYPESMSEINRDMIKYLNRFTAPEIATMEMIKDLPKNIEFDYNRFYLEILNSKLENGRDRYTQKQKDEVINSIKQIMNDIHNLNYFSIARNMKKTKFRQYIKNYYTFKNEEDKKLFQTILNNNVLIIDDIVTSGTTISYLLNSLRSVNDSNNIVIFSLIGKNIN